MSGTRPFSFASAYLQKLAMNVAFKKPADKKRVGSPVLCDRRPTNDAVGGHFSAQPTRAEQFLRISALIAEGSSQRICPSAHVLISAFQSFMGTGCPGAPRGAVFDYRSPCHEYRPDCLLPGSAAPRVSSWNFPCDPTLISTVGIRRCFQPVIQRQEYRHVSRHPESELCGLMQLRSG